MNPSLCGREPAGAAGLVRVAALTMIALFSESGYAAIDCSGTIPIYEIQGAGHISPYDGQTVETCGVVTAVSFSGYYIQDTDGDGDTATSDGIFVLQSGDKPEVGTLVRLSDEVSEFIPGGASTGNLSITNLTFPDLINFEAGQALPEPVVIGPSGRLPSNTTVISSDETANGIILQLPEDAAATPFDPDEDALDFFESLEGMLVTVEQPVAVSAIRQFGAFSAEVFVLPDNGSNIAPLDARSGRGGILLQPDPDNNGDQNPERVQIQFDATLFGSTSYPQINVGDTMADVTGVVGYSFGNFEVNALGAFDISSSGLVPEVAVPSVNSNLSIATYNVLNLSAVEGDDAQRQLIARQIVNNLHSPDIIALQEIQDNNGDVSDCDDDTGPCSGVLDATETLSALRDEITAAGGPVYKYFTVDPLIETGDDNRDDPDAFGGASFSNIRNAFFYNDARVTLSEYTGLTRDVLADRGVSVSTAFDTSRDPLEAVFQVNGRKIVVINNHFSSRFGSTPIFGAVQPFVQAAEAQREAQSLAMYQVTRWWLELEPETDVIVLGDLNTFEWTNDLSDLLRSGGTDATLLYDLSATNADNNRYSFIFEGNSQALDHIYVTNGLLAGASADYVHVNNDFSRRTEDVTASDHEPVLGWLAVGAACIDSDGDGWGWNGISSCRIGSIARGECIDTDGDGFGWDGIDTCLPSRSECIDSDGDGWGWTGSASCRVGEIPVSQCVDEDGDGYGWNGVATCFDFLP